MKRTRKLIIDSEFQKLLEPHTPEELEQLEENILKHPRPDPIVVWRGENIVVDGMTRYEIYEKHGLLSEVKVHYMDFDTRAEVAEFIRSNQLGRRNLSPEAKAKVRQELIERISKAAADGKTEREIGKDENISPSQVHRCLEKATSQVAFAPGGAKKTNLIPELANVPMSPKMKPKVEALPRGKQKDIVPLERKYGIKKAYDMVMSQREPGDEANESNSPNGELAGLPKDVRNALADTWHADCARTLAAMRKQCLAAFNWSRWLDKGVLDALKQAEDYFLAAIPRRACPACYGQKEIDQEKCDRCDGFGYLAAQA